MLTDTAIRAAKPKDKPYKLTDSGGLYLLIGVSGSKVWKWKYHIAGKEKLLTIGPYPIVPLSRQAVELLQKLREKTGHGKYVFTTPRAPKGDRPMSENAVLVALRSMGFEKDEVTGHGFRATFRTLADEVLGERVDLIEQQLAHVVRAPLGRAYNRTKFIDQRREMMQRWADYLDTLLYDQAHSTQ